jgi:hypothetical protein
MKLFFWPGIFSLIVLVALFFWYGIAAVYIAILLFILEVTLSFDNAVVNARILEHMDEKWRKRFLTWGIAIAVFGTRFLLPILIVSASLFIDPWTVTKLALFDPEKYGDLLHDAHYIIGSFGAVFLLMVSLKFFFDAQKETHWFHALENHLRAWGRVESMEIVIALLTLIGVSYLVPASVQASVLVSGSVGLALFIFMQGLANYMRSEVVNIANKGLALFLFLEIIDTAFSLDSVVGAFALTTTLPIIMLGLAIGAYFVRSLTLYFVENKTLDKLIYLEHGAHYAIFGLSISMFVSMVTPLSELVTGTVGVLFVALAYWSSVRANKASSAIAQNT